MLLAEPKSFHFPEIARLEDNPVEAETAWRVQKTLDINTNGENVFSIKYHPDGKSLIIGTTDFNIFRIRLSDGSQIWKASAKMMFQKEFDGPEIYDVSPDGKYFLSLGQARPEVQASERFLVLRSLDKGQVVKNFPVEQSLFYSERANINYRYPGAEEEQRRIESELGFNWILTIDQATFIEGGKKILASYKHNMEGANFYDRRLVLYDTATGKKLNDFQLTCDPTTANWDQPAGFEIAHIQFPFTYSNKKKTILLGTSHGRIHEVDESTMAKNIKIPLVEKKPAGNVVYIPLSDSEDLATKDRQSVRSIALSPDGRILYVSAGIEGGYIQLYAFDLESKKELFRSTLFDAGKLIAPSNDILVIGGMFSSAKFFIADIKSGHLVFAAENEENYVHPQIFATNPLFKEVAGLRGGNRIAIIRPSVSDFPW
jgi:WD40 repeat protein